MNWNNEVLFITGASSGLGRALAVRAAERGATLVLVARDKVRLDGTCREVKQRGGKARSFLFELTEVEGIADFYQQVKEQSTVVPTILFNVAGYNAAGFVQNTPLATYEHNYRVNTLAPIALIQAMLPDMVKQQHGVIVNIMSAAMYHAFPGMSSYGSSKAALKAVHQSLKAELDGLPVKTLYVEPGGFESSYWKNLKASAGKRLGQFNFSTERQDRDPAFVAGKILDAIERGSETFILEGIMDKIGYHLNYWAPSLVDRLIAKRNHRLISNRPDYKE